MLKLLTLSAAVLTLTATSISAQETTAGGNLGQQANWSALQNQLNATNSNLDILRSDIEAIKTCATTGQIWQPGKGCISVGGKLDHIDVIRTSGTCTARVKLANEYVGNPNTASYIAASSVMYFGVNGDWMFIEGRKDCSPMSNSGTGRIEIPKDANNNTIKGFYKIVN